MLTTPGKFLLVPTAANGQAAFAAYLRAPDGRYKAHAIHLLTTNAGSITRIVSFNDGHLAAAFGLPTALAPGTAEMPASLPR